MIKQDIVHHVIERTGLPRTKAEAAVDTVFEGLKQALAAGERIELRGFGVFSVRARKTGIGRNPRTGTEVSIAPGQSCPLQAGQGAALARREAARRSLRHKASRRVSKPARRRQLPSRPGPRQSITASLGAISLHLLSSHQPQCIHVHDQIAARHACLLRHAPACPRITVLSALRDELLQNQVKAINALDARDRRGARSQHPHAAPAFWFWQIFAQVAAHPAASSSFCRLHQHIGQHAEGRVMHPAAILQLAFGKGCVVVCRWRPESRSDRDNRSAPQRGPAIRRGRRGLKPASTVGRRARRRGNRAWRVRDRSRRHPPA